jgi:hypothetical protein
VYDGQLHYYPAGRACLSLSDVAFNGTIAKIRKKKKDEE